MKAFKAAQYPTVPLTNYRMTGNRICACSATEVMYYGFSFYRPLAHNFLKRCTEMSISSASRHYKHAVTLLQSQMKANLKEYENKVIMG